MERFTMVRHSDHEHCGLESDPNGPYITFRDHEARVIKVMETSNGYRHALEHIIECADYEAHGIASEALGIPNPDENSLGLD